MENLHHFSQTIIVFILLVVACLLIDIVSHKSDKPITLKNATFFSIFWIGVSLVFGVYLYFAQGKDMAFLFYADIDESMRVGKGGGVDDESIELVFIPRESMTEFMFDESKPKGFGLLFAYFWWKDKFKEIL